MSLQLFSQKVTARAACLAWLSAVSVGGQGPAAVDPSAHALPRRPVRTKGRHRDGRGGKCSLEGGCWHMVEWRGISCFPAGPAPLPRGVHPRLPGARGTGRDGVGRRALARPLTWSAPGWSPGSPRERCWPSGPSAGAPPACSGTRAGIRPWLRCATGTASSSSSRGGFWKESALSQGRRRPRGRASGGATSAAHAPSPGRPGPRTRAKRPRAVVQRAHVRASPP